MLPDTSPAPNMVLSGDHLVPEGDAPCPVHE